MNEHIQNNQQPDLINLLLEDGLENAIPKISELLINAAMILERIQHIGANPNERNVEDRNGYANGFKPRSYQTALGKLQLQVPQIRDRTSRACGIEGVSTRRVTTVMEKLCGFQVSSTQV